MEYDNWSMTVKLVLWETEAMLKEINMGRDFCLCLVFEQKIPFHEFYMPRYQIL